MNFYEMLDHLESLQGSNDKEEYLIYILKHVKNAEAFFRFTFNDLKYGVQEQTFKNAYSDYQTTENHISDWFGETYLKTDGQTTSGDSMKNMLVIDLLDFGLLLTNLSGGLLNMELRVKFDSIARIKRKWFCRAILKDLRCGVQLTTVNKAFKYCGLKAIETYSVMLCQKVDLYNPKDVKKKLKFPCSMECKYDGFRIQADLWVIEKTTNTEGVVVSFNYEMGCTLTSRRGTDKTLDYPEIVAELKKVFAGENIILDGEVISSSFQNLTRKDSTAQKKFVIFDLLMDEQLPYRNRWDNLYNLLLDKEVTAFNDNKNIKYNNNILAVAEHYSCNSLQEAQDYYEELNRREEEGVIIKIDSEPYFRSAKKKSIMPMYKCKKVYDADLLCVGYKLGTGKRSGMVSTLCLQDASKTYEVDVGSGIDDATSEYLTNIVRQSDLSKPDFMGTIVEINYNELTVTGSLRFPRFIKFREDKTEPDDLSTIKVRQK